MTNKVLLEDGTGHENIVKIGDNSKESLKNSVDHGLEDSWSFNESRRKDACSGRAPCPPTTQGTYDNSSLSLFEDTRRKVQPSRRAYHRINQYKVLLDEEADTAACLHTS